MPGTMRRYVDLRKYGVGASDTAVEISRNSR